MSGEQRARVHNLSRLLRDDGASILSDGASLCLTTGFLQFINKCCATISDSDFNASFETLPGGSVYLPLYEDIQFVYDFMQRTPKLKLVGEPGVTSIPLSLINFRALRELELKKIEIIYLQGLNRLHGHLQVIICTRCLSRIEDLLDRFSNPESTTALVWTKLTRLCLSYNYLIELDNSLRLLPVLRSLDVSHNDIYDTQTHLQHLTEIVEINLSYNHLVTIPTFSYSAHSKLVKLLIQHNNLENIQGIEMLIGLEDLDLAYNCLPSHGLLWPLKSLPKLRQLSLKGNPMTYHNQHRLLTLQHLHPTAAQRVVLDYKAVIEQESSFISRCSLLESSEHVTRPAQAFIQLPPDFASSLDESLAYGNSLSSLQRNGMNFSEPGKTPRKKRVRNHKRARKVEIGVVGHVTTSTDQDSPEGSTQPNSSTSNSYGLSVTEEQLVAQKKVETMRSQLGSAWLKTYTESQGLTNRRQDKNNPKKSRIHNLDNKELAQLQISNNNVCKTGNRSEVSSKMCNLDVVADDDGIVSLDVPYDDDGVFPLQADLYKMKIDNVSFVSARENSKDNLNSTDNVRVNESKTPTSGNDDNSENIFKWTKSETMEIDFGLQSEPFIVQRLQLRGDISEHFLLTVAERYLVERDIVGNLIEMLDQRSLQHAEILETSENAKLSSELANDSSVVRLMFDYYKKDRKVRCYIMEDESAAQLLMELLEPSLDLRTMANALRDMLQCLKCGQEFSQAETVRQYEQERSGVIKRCPKCDSDIVIKLDEAQISRSVGQQGFLSDNQAGMKHEILAQSTPIRKPDNNRLVYQDKLHDLGARNNTNGDSSHKTSASRSQTTDSYDEPVILNDSANITAMRQMSESSDIVVLEKKSSTASLSGNSEATLSAPGLSPITDSPLTQTLDSSRNSDQSICQLPTPGASLPSDAITSMVSSIYENSLAKAQHSKDFLSTVSNRNISENNSFKSVTDPERRSVQSLTSSDTVEDVDRDTDVVNFSFTDFKQIDHRLKLFLTLNFINDEEVNYILKCGIVTEHVPEYPGLLVVTDTKLYLFSIVLPCRASRMDSDMNLMDEISITNIRYIDLGFGGQCFRILTMRKNFAFIIRDQISCKSFLKSLTELVQKTVQAGNGQLEGIKKDYLTLQNFTSQVFSMVDSRKRDTIIRLFIMCHLQLEVSPSEKEVLTPVSLGVTSSHIAMATEDFQSTLQSLSLHRSESKVDKQQFQFKDAQTIFDLTYLELSHSNPLSVILTFIEERGTYEYKWRLIMATTQTRDAFVKTVTKLWKDMFIVDFTITYS